MLWFCALSIPVHVSPVSSSLILPIHTRDPRADGTAHVRWCQPVAWKNFVAGKAFRVNHYICSRRREGLWNFYICLCKNKNLNPHTYTHNTCTHLNACTNHTCTNSLMYTFDQSHKQDVSRRFCHLDLHFRFMTVRINHVNFDARQRTNIFVHMRRSRYVSCNESATGVCEDFLLWLEGQVLAFWVSNESALRPRVHGRFEIWFVYRYA